MRTYGILSKVLGQLGGLQLEITYKWSNLFLDSQPLTHDGIYSEDSSRMVAIEKELERLRDSDGGVRTSKMVLKLPFQVDELLYTHPKVKESTGADYAVSVKIL